MHMRRCSVGICESQLTHLAFFCFLPSFRILQDFVSMSVDIMITSPGPGTVFPIWNRRSCSRLGANFGLAFASSSHTARNVHQAKRALATEPPLAHKTLHGESPGAAFGIDFLFFPYGSPKSEPRFRWC